VSRRLVLVYNANAGLLAGAMDSLHKLFSPATYPCALCAITYGLVGMKPEWRAWLDGLGMPVLFHHRPDFRAAFPAAADWPLPVVALEQDGQLQLLLGPDDFTGLKSVADLKAALGARLG
jgi:hypothetical protein